MAVAVSGHGVGIDEPTLPPFQAVTTKDRGAVARLSATISFTVTALVVVVKLSKAFGPKRKPQLNDVVIVFSTVGRRPDLRWHIITKKLGFWLWLCGLHLESSRWRTGARS